MKDDEVDPNDLAFVRLVADTMAHAAKEVLLLAQLEQTFDPQPANITGTEDQVRALEQQATRLVAALGGRPRLMVVVQDRPKPRYDTYAAAAVDEAITMFHRARATVCRAHLHFIAGGVIERTPDLLTWPSDERITAIMQRMATSQFWERAESAYVKLASLWDRLGQLLDSAFFGIRQYERDGFPSVMDRIYANHLPVHTELRESSAWVAVRAYQTSEKPDGLKWLLRRRNLIIHSIHLRPSPAGLGNDPLFEGAYNHLEESHRRRLAPGSRDDEIKWLHSHLSTAATLFTEVLYLCEFGPICRVGCQIIPKDGLTKQ